MIVAAIIIKIRSPGPVFYQHVRVGRGSGGSRPSSSRTMVQDADRSSGDYLNRHPELQEEWDRDHKLRHDPRIIPVVGRLLRLTSLDEAAAALERPAGGDEPPSARGRWSLKKWREVSVWYSLYAASPAGG